MQVERIDGFSGDDHAYLEYLFKKFSGISVHNCIRWLEEGLAHERQTPSRASPVRYPTPPPDKHMPVFERWNPSSIYRQGLPANQSASKQKFQEEVERFLEGLPASEAQWLDKRKSIGLSSADDTLRAVDCLTTRQFDDDNSGIRCDTQCPDLQDVSESMKQRVLSLIGTGQFGYNISQFMSLVFTATCCVALYKGHPESSVEVTQQNFLLLYNASRRASPAQLRKYRAAVRWLLQEKQRQFRRGLRHRAFEMFINEGKSNRFYTRCPRDDKFTNRIPLCEVPDEIQASLPLWIPFFVKLNTGWSYTSICEALGTSLLSKEEDFHNFKRAYKKIAACRIQEIPPARLDQCGERVLRRRISTTGEDAAVQTHGWGSDNPRSKGPWDPPVPRPRQAGLSCQSPPISPMEASSPSSTGFTTSCSSEEVRTTRFRPINGSKHYRGESTTPPHDSRAKRGKTQQSEEGQGHDGVSNFPDESRTAQAPLEGLAGRCTGQEGALPPAVIAHYPKVSLLPGHQPTHAGSELSDKPHEYNLNHTLPKYSLGHSDSEHISKFLLLLAAAEQGHAATGDTGRMSDGGTVSREGFRPTGNSGLMLGESEQSGAGQLTSQTERPNHTVPRWGARSYSMMDTAYETGDEESWKEFLIFD